MVYKFTKVTGNTGAPKPAPRKSEEEFLRQWDLWYRVWIMDGHCEPDEALKYAQTVKRVVSTISCEYQVVDPTPPRTTTIVRRFTVTQDGFVTYNDDNGLDKP